MTRPASIARQILYAAAMTTGVALMGMLAGCARPESSLAAPGFPHASRRSTPRTEPSFEQVSTGWSDTSVPVKKVATETLREALWIRP